MPELPEVETVARGLAATVTGRTIAAVTVNLPRVIDRAPQAFASALTGERITEVGRRGKFVVAGLSSGARVAVHLRMTGRLIFQPKAGAPPEPYSNVILDFTDGSRLCFADPRTFGRMRILAQNEPVDAKIGIEPLSEDFTFVSFTGMLGGRSTPIKVFLLDQRHIAGLGNIYACEALWQAGIRPTRPAGSLTSPARQRLYDSIKAVLAEAIEMRGTSARDYVDAEGLRGGFQNRLSVYGRDGEPCARCGTAIVRTVVAQRGTWWCRTCQRR